MPPARYALLIALGAAWTAVHAQSHDSGAAAAPDRASAPAPELPNNATLAGPGPIVASPLHPGADTPRGAAPPLPSRTTRLARVLGNGTALNYGQGGANALGNTGGLTTGAMGNAGAVGGGSGVHAGAIVIAPGQVNGAMRSDDARERYRPGTGAGADSAATGGAVAADPTTNNAPEQVGTSQPQ
jgi:hypothetical protein